MNDDGTPGARPGVHGATSSDRWSARASALLRQHTDAGWRSIEDSVVHRALALYRPSAPVRGRHDLGEFFLAADLVVAHLRRRIDEVPDAAAERITCTTGEQEALEQVTIQLTAAFGAVLLQVAGQVHAVAMDALTDLLGTLAPAAEQVRTHVHVTDVTEDSRLVT